MALKQPIVVTEYPKSGGSWIVSLIGDALDIDKRDIYVRPGFDLFEISKHPWYSNAQELNFPTTSVIKSHELPHSPLFTFEATYMHLVRDGRDVITSKWFFERDFCVKNGITNKFEKDFSGYLKEQAQAWCNYIAAWSSTNVSTVKYENFLEDPVGSLQDLLRHLTGQNINHRDLTAAVEKNTKENFSASMDEVFKHNTFVRKGISGDWKNHFSEENISDFETIAGSTLKQLGYTW